MKPFVPLLVLATALAGCGPLSTWYKPGARVDQMQDDLVTCRVAGARDVPVSTQVRVTPVTYVPHTICDKQNQCRTVYEAVGGEVITYDANASLRAQAVGQCMMRKGYSRVDIPPCPDGIRNAAPAARTVTMPKLAANSCSIRNRDGSWQVVTPG